MIWPPTPTPYPAGVPPLDISPGQFSLWNSTDWAIQMWNGMGNGGLLLQLLLIAVLVWAGVIIVVRSFEVLARKDAES